MQVVSEAADACACAMLAACPSQRLLPKLLTTLAADKNGRLRQAAAEWLLVALERWEPAEWERQLEAVERSVLAAASDAQGETRATARALFAAYARAAPAAAAAALARLGNRDRALQEKLAAAVAAAGECRPGGCLPGGVGLASWHGSCLVCRQPWAVLRKLVWVEHANNGVGCKHETQRNALEAYPRFLAAGCALLCHLLCYALLCHLQARCLRAPAGAPPWGTVGQPPPAACPGPRRCRQRTLPAANKAAATRQCAWRQLCPSWRWAC